MGRPPSGSRAALDAPLARAAAFYEGPTSWRLVLAWIGAAAAQAGTNLTNVSYNYKAGAGAEAEGSDFEPNPGASSAIVWTGRLEADQVRRGAYLCFGVATAAGAALGILLVAGLAAGGLV